MLKNIRNILCMAILTGSCSLLLPGCANDEDAPDEQRNVSVLLNVGTRAVTETDGTPSSDEAALHTLRVYAFIGGRPAGHLFLSGNVLTDPDSYLMDLKLYSDGISTVDFYVIANEAAMTTPSASPYQFTVNTTEAELNSYNFTQFRTPVATYGLPMFCKQSESIDFTNDATAAPSPTPQNAADHVGHTLLDYKFTFPLERPMGKLGVFAAKTPGETGVLQITGLTILASGKRLYNYLMPQTLATLQAIPNETGDINLTPVATPVTATIADNDPNRTDPSYYDPVLGASFYPFENPWGSSLWSTPGDAGGNVLKIDFNFDGDARTGYVYLPAIERNHYYAVCCLMNNDGVIRVEYYVADWDDVIWNDLVFDYPTYSNPIQPFGGLGTQPYPQPEVFYNSDTSSEYGKYSFSFTISGPAGQTWSPTLLDGTPSEYEITVLQYGSVVPPVGGTYPVSPDPYQIKIKALDHTKEGDEVKFAIACTPMWDPYGTLLLLINGQSGSPAWAGSADPEVVVIRQGTSI